MTEITKPINDPTAGYSSVDMIISPVSPSRRNLKEGHRAMDISDFAEDYLVDVPIDIGTLSP